jgi:hypothetical protein
MRILPVSVEAAYNLPMVTVQHQGVTQDAHSGYTTYNLNWNILSIGIPN